MKNFVILFTFVSTTLFGLVISDSIKFSSNLNDFLRSEGAQRSDDKVSESFFTLQEADSLLGEKVISRNSNPRKSEIGRIVSFEMVAPEEFLIQIYWGNGAQDEISRITFHNKESFSRDFEVID